MSALTDDSPIVVTEPLSFEDGGDSDDLVHVACDCSEEIALCGTELTFGVDEWTDDELCVVCKDLEPLPCPRCGEKP
jgi:hypothetical protein